MNRKLQAYIDRINAGDPTLRKIDLAFLNLGDTDITALMMALKSKPNVAQQITVLYLDSNRLTMATKIALEALGRTLINNNFQLNYDNPVPAATQLTAEILEEHFEALKDVFVSELSSPAVKFAILNCAWQGNIRVGWECLPFELIDMALEMHGLGATGLLGKEIANFNKVDVPLVA